MRWIQGLAVTAVLACQSVTAATPEEIFEKASPSIVVIEVQGSQGEPVATGSGVIVGQITNGSFLFDSAPATAVGDLAQIATNCHVAKAGPVLFVHHRGQRYEARLEESDPERDVCLVVAPKLNFASDLNFALEGTYRPGARVYAIGAPEGLELTISEGLISGLRKLPDGSTVIQTSAPISPGSSGGGLFDTDGRLVGITTAFLPDGQNLNFAIPLEWIIEMPQRARKAQQQFASGHGLAAPQPAPAAVPKRVQPPSTSALTSDVLRDLCQFVLADGGSASEMAANTACMSYIGGFRDGVGGQSFLTQARAFYCPPPQLSTDEIAKAFVRWYDRQPTGDKGLAVTALAAALMNTYPCEGSVR